jgi:hypothetical protein
MLPLFIATLIALTLLVALVPARSKVLGLARRALASAAVILLVVAIIVAIPHAIVGLWSLIATSGSG